MKTRFLNVSQFRKKYFAEGSAPCEHTVRQWILLKKLPGLVINGKYFVNEDQWVESLNNDEPMNEDISQEDLQLLDEFRNIKRITE